LRIKVLNRSVILGLGTASSQRRNFLARPYIARSLLDTCHGLFAVRALHCGELLVDGGCLDPTPKRSEGKSAVADYARL